MKMFRAVKIKNLAGDKCIQFDMYCDSHALILKRDAKCAAKELRKIADKIDKFSKDMVKK